ncbi:MAG: BatD family protein [Gammaproteobacteria bacterium]|nr:BatD family protein [Gammaproteobacteria bacterium]
MVKRLTQILTFAIGSLLMSAPSLAADIQVRSDRNPVSLNESFRLVYETSGSVDDDPDFSPLSQELDILNRSQNSSFSYRNGDIRSSKSWTLTVMAKRSGELILPPIAFGRDKSPSYQLTVKPASQQLGGGQGSFFTQIEVDQSQLYVQQQLVITQQLFSVNRLSAFGMQPPEISGMDVLTVDLGDERQYRTQIGNLAYMVVEKSYAVFPQQSGQLQIAPALAEGRIGSSSSSLFDSFGQRGQLLRARSNNLQVEVLPMPANANMTPWLPARGLQITEQWPQQPPRLVQGEPVTRTLSIKADGLTAAQIPELPALEIDGLKQYPDQPLLNDIENDNGVSGYRVDKVAFIPTRPGRITLPALEIPWWNTQTQRREVARIPARDIEVMAASPGLTQPPAPMVSAPQGLQQPSPAQSSSQPVIGEPGIGWWKWLAMLLGGGWLLTILLWVYRSRKTATIVDAEPSNPQPTARQSYRRLAQACDEQDLHACRAAVLAWARIVLAPARINVLNDLGNRLPAEMTAEINRIDAVLYGGQQQAVDFALIKQQARQLMQQPGRQQPSRQVLEPLYK